MSDGSVILAAGISLAQMTDPLSTFQQFGYPGLIILFLAVVWVDSKRTEKMNREDQKEREKAQAERDRALNETLGELKTLIGRLIERHDSKDG